MCERFAFINHFHFTDQDLSGSGYGETCEFSDFVCWLTNDGGVQCAIFQDDVLNRFQLFALQQVAAVACEALAHRIIDRINHNNGLLRSTDNAVIEGFGHQDRSDSTFDISRFVDNNRGVTCAYADCWFTRAVCCFNHAWATGCQDQVNVRVMHQCV